MIKIIFLLLPIFCFGTNILNVNVYERSDRIDIMLSFDSPYKGQIVQKEQDGITLLTLADLQTDKPIEKTINSDIINSLTIKQGSGATEVTLQGNSAIGIVASKTIDEFGLRIRAQSIQTKNEQESATAAKPIQSNVATNETIAIELDYRYYLTMAFMLALLVFLYFFKRKILLKNTEKNTWLFKGKQYDVNILFQKNIDIKNKIMLIEYEGGKYLVMTGTSNLLLDKFKPENIQTKDDFEDIFEQNRKKLDDFLKLKDKKFEEYKDKASSIHIPTISENTMQER